MRDYEDGPGASRARWLPHAGELDHTCARSSRTSDRLPLGPPSSPASTRRRRASSLSTPAGERCPVTGRSLVRMYLRWGSPSGFKRDDRGQPMLGGGSQVRRDHGCRETPTHAQGRSRRSPGCSRLSPFDSRAPAPDLCSHGDPLRRFVTRHQARYRRADLRTTRRARDPGSEGHVNKTAAVRITTFRRDRRPMPNERSSRRTADGASMRARACRCRRGGSARPS